VLTPGVREDVGRVLVHDLHVRNERGSRVEPFEEVVREECVLRDTPAHGRLEGVHVVEPFSREDAFAEEILVRVRDGRRIRVDAGVPGVDARKQRPAALASVTLTRGWRMP